MAVKAGDERTEVDASGEAESVGSSVCQPSRVNLTGSRNYRRRRRGLGLGEVNLVGKRLYMFAKVNLRKHAVILQRLEASNLRDEVHDPVVAAHQFPQATDAIAEVLLAVGVCKLRVAAEHSGTEDVDPRRQGHVYRGDRKVILGNVLEEAGEVELVDEVGHGLEVLVPWNVWKAIIWGADRALE